MYNELKRSFFLKLSVVDRSKLVYYRHDDTAAASCGFIATKEFKSDEI